MRYKNLLIATVFMGGSILATSSAYAVTATQEFVTKASISGKFEVDSSELALQKSSDEDVKSVAQMMVDDHTKANHELKETLEQNKVNAVPSNKLDLKHQRLMNKLESASGKDFDRQYIAIQTTAHEEAIALFTNYSQNGRNQSVKAFAARTLPTLKKHLSHIENLNTTHVNGRSAMLDSQCYFKQRMGMESMSGSNAMTDRASVNASPSYMDRTFSANWDYPYFGISERDRECDGNYHHKARYQHDAW